jgi:hypothetical protein
MYAVYFIGQHTDGVERRVTVTPQLDSLNGTDALDLAKAVSAAVNIGPHHIRVEEGNQVPLSQIALETNRAVDRCEFVSNLDILIVYA